MKSLLSVFSMIDGWFRHKGSTAGLIFIDFSAGSVTLSLCLQQCFVTVARRPASYARCWPELFLLYPVTNVKHSEENGL